MAQAKGSFGTLFYGSWGAMRGEHARFFLFVVLFVGAYVAELLSPWAIGRALAIVVNEGVTAVSYPHIFNAILVYGALRLVQGVLHHYARYVQSQVGYLARMSVLNKIFKNLLSFELSWHTHSHSGENLSKIQRSSRAIDNVIGTYAWQIIEGTVKVALAAAALYALDWKVAMVVASMTALTIFSIVYFNRRMVRNLRKSNQLENRVNGICIDNLTNIVTIKTLHLERQAEEYLVQYIPDGLKLVRRIARVNEVKWGAIAVGYAVVMSSSLLIYLKDHQGTQSPNQIAQIYVIISYLDKIFEAVRSFSSYFGGLVESSTAYEDAAGLEHPGEIEETKRLKSGWREVRVHDLRFSYIQGESKGLQNVNFGFRHGDKVALIGPSGGGKSTLLKVLSGVLSPQAMKVYADDDEVAYKVLTRSSLLVPQEPQIFSETLLYNLTMGEEFTREQIDEVIRICRLERLLAKLEHGWETNLAENGLNLSGGERQRVALARGLLRARNKDIILFDEPTSSLDPSTEREIYQDLMTQFRDKTILVSCHRWSLLPMFDYILFMEEGRLRQKTSTRGFLESLKGTPLDPFVAEESRYVDYLPGYDQQSA